MAEEPDLKSAYALTSNAEVEALYDDWAFSYDTSFGQAQGYQSPREIALGFIGLGGTGPVLDVGAGTGLVAEFLTKASVTPIDAIDLSASMLDVARSKGIYRNLIVADVTKPIENAEGPYNGIVSAGTFTHGHVGPEGIPPLLDLAASGAVFALSVNREHFANLGFEAAIVGLSDQIEDVKLRDFRIYDDRADAEHRDDLASLLSFRKR